MRHSLTLKRGSTIANCTWDDEEGTFDGFFAEELDALADLTPHVFTPLGFHTTESARYDALAFCIMCLNAGFGWLGPELGVEAPVSLGEEGPRA